MPERCSCRDCIGRDRFLQEAQRAIEEAQAAENDGDADSSARDAISHLEAYLDQGDQ